MSQILQTTKLAPVLLQPIHLPEKEPEILEKEGPQGRKKGGNHAQHLTQEAVQVETHPQKLITKLESHYIISQNSPTTQTAVG